MYFLYSLGVVTFKKLNNFVNFDFFSHKLSGIDRYEKRIDYPGGHAWGHVFMACSKLEAMVIYLIKQACGNYPCFLTQTLLA